MNPKQNQSSPANMAEVNHAAGLRLLGVYSSLAQQGEHLLGGLLDGQAPRQWEHYPDDDAIDAESGFQWFYHSHSPEDRADSPEHGHVHLFARRKRWERRLQDTPEISFARLQGGTTRDVNTRHLLAISFDAKGIPVSIFTVNSWVTGDRMLSAENTASLLHSMRLATGYPQIDTVIESLVCLYATEIQALLNERDQRLFSHPGELVLADESLEVLSEHLLQIDEKLATVCG